MDDLDRDTLEGLRTASAIDLFGDEGDPDLCLCDCGCERNAATLSTAAR